MVDFRNPGCHVRGHYERFENRIVNCWLFTLAYDIRVLSVSGLSMPLNSMFVRLHMIKSTRRIITIEGSELSSETPSRMEMKTRKPAPTPTPLPSALHFFDLNAS